MSDEPPAWPEDTTPPDVKPDRATGRSRKVNRGTAEFSAKPASRNPALSSAQLLVLTGLALLLCAICAGTAGAIYTGRDVLFGPSPHDVAAGLPPQAAPIASVPALTITNTPAHRPTIALPHPTAIPAPSATATYAVAPEFINKDKIAEIKEFVEKWRELSLPEDVPIKFLTRAQLREQWQEDSFDKAAIEAAQKQQQFYAALGLIKPDVDLVQAALDSQTDIMLGYYAPEEKTMYIIAESVNMFAQEEISFAHEHVHALQDYHFDLRSILDEEASGDQLLAERALPEGDARLVEDLFTRQNITQDQLDYTVYRYLFQEHPQLEGVSPALSIFTYFPYTAGEYFAIYLFIKGNYSWDLVNRAYSNPPVSSEQVMHPEKYLAREMPVAISLPDLAPTLGDAWHELDRNVLGEIGLLVWLIDQVDEQTAINGATGWDGDAYSLWVDNANHRLLVALSEWETHAEAIEFFEAFNSYMNLREGDASRFEEAGGRFWEYEEGIMLLSRNGKQVLIVIAPDRSILDKVHRQFTGF